MKQIEKRLRALEAAAESPQHYEKLPEGRLGKILTAQRIAFALRLGANAREELAEAGASLKPERRAELGEHLAAARSIAMTLEAAGPPREMPLSAATVIPGSLDGLLVAVI